MDILMYICYGIFIVQFILSWIGSGLIDFDFDGVEDLSLSDLCTFKGLIHFLIGFSTWVNFNSPVIHWTTYVTAIGIGVAFSIVLYYSYKIVLNLKYEPTIEVVGKTGRISFIGENYIYVNVNGSEIRAKKSTNYKVGDKVTILSLENGVYNIQ